MFGIYFGKYLQDKGLISCEQYAQIMEEVKSSRVKLGLLAVEMRMMSTAQAEEVNHLQTVLDQRFGDIAIDKGYLTAEQVGDLLKKQGDQYLLFVQTLTEHDILDLETIQKELKAYKKDERLSALDVDAIKSSDIDNIVPVFTKESSMPPIVKDYIALVARNIIRFIDTQLRLGQAERINVYQAEYMASQEMKGDYHFFVGFSGEEDAIVDMGTIFAKEQFDVVDEDTLDAVCEFINCNNGLYASKLSEEDVELDMLPPTMYTSAKKISTDGPMYKVPMYISDKRLDLVICLEAKWQIN